MRKILNGVLLLASLVPMTCAAFTTSELIELFKQGKFSEKNSLDPAIEKALSMDYISQYKVVLLQEGFPFDADFNSSDNLCHLKYPNGTDVGKSIYGPCPTGVVVVRQDKYEADMAAQKAIDERIKKDTAETLAKNILISAELKNKCKGKPAMPLVFIERLADWKQVNPNSISVQRAEPRDLFTEDSAPSCLVTFYSPKGVIRCDVLFNGKNQVDEWRNCK